MAKKSKQIIGQIMLFVFAFYYANICFFYHSHIVNGTTIVHSHFHSEDHAQAGTHSENQITLISALSVFQTLQAVSCVVVGVVFLVLLAVILPVVVRKAARHFTTCASLRGPPAWA